MITTAFLGGTESDGETRSSHQLQMEMPQEAFPSALPARWHAAAHPLPPARFGSKAGRKSREAVLTQTHEPFQLQNFWIHLLNSGFRTDVLWTDPPKPHLHGTAGLHVSYLCSLWAQTAAAQLQTSLPAPSLCDRSCNIARNLFLSECNTQMTIVMNTGTNTR